MDAPQLTKLLDSYSKRITDIFPDADVRRNPDPLNLVQAVAHLMWMLDVCRGQIILGRIDKATRWLGFVEGSMVQLRLITIAEILLLDVESVFV